MEKETPTSYETFQFTEGNANPDMNQLIVLQEDGTLLSVNRDVQYITEVQDVKEVMEDVQNCAVFDVSSQQFYVNVENTSDLIVQEQFAIANEDGNMYSNSFVIQTNTETKAAADQMETDTVPALKSDLPIQNEAETTSQVNNFTEITLTDALYHLLEQKGWILLEFGGRVFVLDTAGLHDITNDEKLIEKLKTELEHSIIQQNEQREPGVIRAENIPSEMVKTEVLEIEFKQESETVDPLESDQDIGDFKIENGKSESEPCEPNAADEPDVQESPNVDSQQDNEIFPTTDSQRKCDSIKIKTKYTFNDIPEKIFLGKTASGKSLYAKVTKSKHKEILKTKPDMSTQSFGNEKCRETTDVRFLSILQDYLREHPSRIQISSVIAADSIVSQLMQMPHIMNKVVGSHIVVTKTMIFVSEDGREKTRRRPTIVTGKFNDSYRKFIHTPYMLHNFVNPEAEITTDEPAKLTRDFIEFVHIDVTETKKPRKPSVQSINVCNKKISLDVLRDAKKRHPNPVYACSACAAVFKSESRLKDHLENDCVEAADPGDALTIDTDQLQDQSDSYFMLDTGKEKWYSCLQCEAKFLKASNCKKHIKSHMRPINPNPGSGRSTSDIKEYKCKMCPSKYFHSSSLSKHIVKRHIQESVPLRRVITSSATGNGS